jgi:RNase P/RNase MRP subunit POP5
MLGAVPSSTLVLSLKDIDHSDKSVILRVEAKEVRAVWCALFFLSRSKETHFRLRIDILEINEIEKNQDDN